MPLIQVFLVAVWALIVVRVLAFRATLSLRTLLTFLMLGAVVGPIALPLVQGFFNSYGSYQIYHWPVVAFGVELLLLAPVLAFLFFRRAHRLTSVGDAFLLAFMTGFGYDLIATLAGVASTTYAAAGLSYFPPFTFQGNGVTVAGFGYWTGLIALAIAAAARFLHSRVAAGVAGLVAIFWVTAEISGLAVSQKQSSLLGVVFGNLTLHGLLTPWLCLLALLGLTLWEAKWASSADATAGHGLISQWSAALAALAGGKFGEFLRLTQASRLRRRLALAQKELWLDPSDAYLASVCRELNARLRAMEAAPVAAETPSPAWLKRRLLQIALLAGFVVIVLLLPQISALREFFWKWALLNAPLLPLNLSLLNCILAVIIGWRYLSAAIAPDGSGELDDLLQFSGEDTILQVSLYAVFLGLMYGKTEDLYSLNSLPQLLSLAPAANYDHAQLTTAMMLIVAVATGLSLKRSDALRRQSIPRRRSAALIRTVNLLILIAGLGIVLVIFQQGQILLHSLMGGLLFRIFGRNGNSAGDTLVGVVTIAFSFAVFWGLAVLAERVKAFLMPPPATPASQETAGRTGATAGAR